MREDDFIGQQFYWFTGEVEDVTDPEKMNRVRVRCHGYHGPKEKCPTEDLPWATVMMPSTSQSSGGFGRTHELEKESWVVGFFRDGMSCQDPLVMGSIASKTNQIVETGLGEGHVDLRKMSDLPTETEENYPDNKVYKSKSGHLVEFDNTDGSERIRIRHTNGSSATLEENNNLTVSVVDGGVLNITANGAVNITSGADITLRSISKTRVM